MDVLGGENNDIGEVLLVGEANFSFSISLAKYVSPDRITTTCYESLEALEKCHGRDLIRSNLAELERLKFKSVRFEVDATRLESLFSCCHSFSRIYFMFPHVSGRSNLRKNRDLMLKFFASSRRLLDASSGAVIVALAAGQGGTIFEREPSKRSNPDSWIINQLAQQNGFILTRCEPFQADRFEYYKSTGFRSQAKSFLINDSLVHRFELSLPIDEPIDFNKTFLLETQRFIHPFVELTQILPRFFPPHTCNLISDKLELSIIKNDEYSSIGQTLARLKKDGLIIPKKLNIFGGLVVKNDDNIAPSRENYEVNNLKYEIMLYQDEIDDDRLENRIKSLFAEMNFEIVDNEQSLTVYSSSVKIAELSRSKPELELIIDASALLKDLFKLDDIRVLFSTDRRTIADNKTGVNIAGVEFRSICRPYCIETNKWQHDMSFWCVEFDYAKFLRTIRDGCFGLVRFVRLIDDSFVDGPRRSYCFRLGYESCDRALDWETCRARQDHLRQLLEMRNGLLMR